MGCMGVISLLKLHCGYFIIVPFLVAGGVGGGESIVTKIWVIRPFFFIPELLLGHGETSCCW
jgi:hypothetical protein